MFNFINQINLFDELQQNIIFEDIMFGRKGAILVDNYDKY